MPSLLDRFAKSAVGKAKRLSKLYIIGMEHGVSDIFAHRNSYYLAQLMKVVGLLRCLVERYMDTL
jgi:hypothetical protein